MFRLKSLNWKMIFILLLSVILLMFSYLYSYYFLKKQNSQFIERISTLLDRAEELGLEGRNAEAIELVKKVIDLKPETSNEKRILKLASKAYRFWGNGLRFQDRYEEALEKYEKALQLDPQSGAAVYGMGQILISLGKHEDALRKSEELKRLQPGNIFAFHLAAEALLKLKRYSDCLSECEEALVLNPEDPQSYHLRGICFYFMGKNEESVSCFAKATMTDPYRGTSFMWWGLTLERMENYKEARIKYQRALEVFKQTGDHSGENAARKSLEEVDSLIKKSRKPKQGFIPDLGSILFPERKVYKLRTGNSQYSVHIDDNVGLKVLLKNLKLY